MLRTDATRTLPELHPCGLDRLARTVRSTGLVRGRGLHRLARTVRSTGLVRGRGLHRLARTVGSTGLFGCRGHADPQMAFDARQPNPVVDNALTQPVLAFAQTIEVPPQAVVVLAVQPVRRLKSLIVSAARLPKSLVVSAARLPKSLTVQAVGLLELLTMLSAGLVEFVADLLAAVLLMPDDPERGDHQRDKLRYGFGLHTRHANHPRRRRATRNNKISSNFTANTSRVQTSPAAPQH